MNVRDPRGRRSAMERLAEAQSDVCCGRAALAAAVAEAHEAGNSWRTHRLRHRYPSRNRSRHVVSDEIRAPDGAQRSTWTTKNSIRAVQPRCGARDETPCAAEARSASSTSAVPAGWRSGPGAVLRIHRRAGRGQVEPALRPARAARPGLRPVVGRRDLRRARALDRGDARRRPAPSRSPTATGAPPIVHFPAALRGGGLVAAHGRLAGRGRGARARSARRSTRAPAPRVALVRGLEACAAEIAGVVFAIEEPELFLAPQAHRYLYRLIHRLAERGNQVFFTTHSPGLLSVAALEEVNLVSRDELGVTAVERLRPIDVDDAFRVMCEFDAERAELFFSRAAILVEGMTEKIALPVRLPRARPRRRPRADLDRRVRRQVEPAAVRRDLQAGARPVRRRPRQRHAPGPRAAAKRS